MSQPARQQVALAYILLLLLALLPIALIRYLPLHDYPNHLARMHILAEAGTNAVLNRFYQIEWGILPNLGMDLVVPLLARVISVEDATRLFVALAIVLMTSGTIALYTALHRRLGWWPLLAFLFLYSRIMLFGHVNYLAGVGLFLWAFSAWIWWRERSAPFRIAVFSAIALLLFFCHLYALGLFGLCVVGFELAAVEGRPATPRAWLREGAVLGAPFVVPLALLVFASPTMGIADAFVYDDVADFLRDKLRAVYQLTMNYHVTFDRVTFVVLAGGFAVALALGGIAIDRRMWPVLGLLALAFVLMPDQLFAAELADFRLPAALVLVLIASTTPVRLPAPRLLAAALAALLVVRMGLIAERWHAFDGIYERYLEAIQVVPEGSRMVTAAAQRPDPLREFSPSLMFTNALAVVERSAFVPSVFADAGKQPIRITDAYRDHYRRFWQIWTWPAAPLEELAPSLVAGRPGAGTDDPLFAYDHLLLIYPRDESNPAPEALRQVHAAPLFHLYAVEPP